jgi:hypothetical protein
LTLLTKQPFQSKKRGGEFDVGSDAQEAFNFFIEPANIDQDFVSISDEAAEHIKVLWADAGIQKTWEVRSEYQISDSVCYFFENIDRIKVAACHCLNTMRAQQDTRCYIAVV